MRNINRREFIGGARAGLVEHMRRSKPAVVVRWPGGCFADQYNWRDGTGPRGARLGHALADVFGLSRTRSQR